MILVWWVTLLTTLGNFMKGFAGIGQAATQTTAGKVGATAAKVSSSLGGGGSSFTQPGQGLPPSPSDQSYVPMEMPQGSRLGMSQPSSPMQRAQPISTGAGPLRRDRLRRRFM